jgi:hypothetical protein
MMSVIVGAAAAPHARNVLLAAAAAAVLCGLVIAEIAALPPSRDHGHHLARSGLVTAPSCPQAAWPGECAGRPLSMSPVPAPRPGRAFRWPFTAAR